MSATENTRPLMCIGAANLDRKLRTLAALQMGTSNPASAQESFGGVARNIAENLARLGLPVALLTALGDDAAGLALQAHAQQAGIDMAPTLRLAGAPSGTYTAVLDERGEMIVALADMQLYEALTPQLLASRQRQRVGAALIVADLNLPRDSIVALLGAARQGAPPLVIVAVSQPKMNRLPPDLHGLHLLLLNRGELETRVGHALPDAADVEQACATVLRQGAQQIIVTSGAGGAYYADGAGSGHLPAPLVKNTVDVTGAGDAFAAAVCWSLYQGDGDLRLACRRGLQLAALTLACAATVVPGLAPGVFDALHAGDDDAAPPPVQRPPSPPPPF